jgi:hypothetical protein
MAIVLRAIFICLLLLKSIRLFAQQQTPAVPLFTYSGQVSVQGEWYRMRSVGAEIRPRRPDEMYRFMGSGSIGIKGIQIPFSMMLANNQRNINTPIPLDQNLFEFITNPVNSVGFAPQLKFGKALMGTYVPKFMHFTSGDIRVFGLGADMLLAKKWRVAFHGGNAQLPVAQNPVLGITGAYTRRMYSGKFGYGADDATHLHVGFMRSSDIVGSVPEVLSQIAPQENLVFSVGGKYKIGQTYYVEGEIARSAFTENTLAERISSNNIFTGLLPFNLTSRLGTALRGTIGRNGKVWSVRLYGDYITEGFRTLGYPFMQPDQANYRIEPRMNLKGGKITLSGAIGQRINNVSGLKGATAYQLTGMLNANWQATERLSVAAGFNNFGFRNTVRNDTLRVENVNRSLNISPTYTIPATRYTHVFNLTFSRDAFDDFNLITGAQNSNNAVTWMAGYVLTWNDKPLTFDLTAMQFDNRTAVNTMLMRNLTAGTTYKFFDKKMNSSLKLTYMSNAVDFAEPSRQLMLQLGYRYSIMKKLALDTGGNINLFRFGAEQPGVRFTETLLRSSLTYTFK